MRGNKLLSLRRKRSCDPFATSKRQEQLRLTSLVTLFEQAWSGVVWIDGRGRFLFFFLSPLFSFFFPLKFIEGA
jgi:hypothetical protein